MYILIQFSVGEKIQQDQIVLFWRFWKKNALLLFFILYYM